MQNKKFYYINLIYFVSLLCLVVSFGLIYLKIIDNEIISTLLIQIAVITAIPCLMYTLIVSKSSKQTAKDFGFKKTSFKIILIAIALGVVIYVLNIFVSTFFQSLIYTMGYNDTFLPPILGIDPFVSDILLIAVLPGICEEILHRGMLLGGLKKITNPRLALVLSSLFFGLMHLDIVKFFYATFLGLLIGYVVLVSDSIFTGMIMHFMNNFLSVYFAYAESRNLFMGNARNILIDIVFDGGAISTVLIVSAILITLISLYRYLVQTITKIKMRQRAEEVVKSLNMENLSQREFVEKMSLINSILVQVKSKEVIVNMKKTKSNLSFNDKIFAICIVILGVLGTLATFIWGIM